MRLFKGLILSSILYCLLYATDIDKANEYFYLGNYRKAIEFYKKGLPTASNPYQIYYNLGVCYEMLGNFETSLFYYRKASPLRTSDVKRAIARVEKKVKRIKIASLTGRLKTSLSSGDYRKALELADEILKLDPKNSWAENQKGLIIAKLSKEKKPQKKPKPPPPPPPKASKKGIPLYALLPLIIIPVIILLYLFRRRKGLPETLLRLIRETEAGMVSIKRGSDLGILFFEDGKVVNAYWENNRGGTKEVLEGEEALSLIFKGTPLKEILSSGKESAWTKFGKIFINIHREAEEELKKKT